MQDQIVLEPPLYFAQQHIWDLSFHPNNDVLACSLITGTVQILKYTSDDVKPLLTLTDLHKSSVRTCTFNKAGSLLSTGGKDKRLGFVDQNGSILHIIKKAHQDPINKVYFLNDQTLVSGDDEGVVKIWDLRNSNCIYQVNEQSQAITGITYSNNHNFMLTSSLDGTLAVYDLRKGGKTQSQNQDKSLYALSDCMEEDLLGVQLVKNQRFVACNSSEGVILLFKWDWFGNCKDRIQGHPNSIDAMIKLNQDTVITGSQDGFVRGVSIYPNKIVQILGQHQQDEHFPIQKISLSHCKKILASCSHDNSIKFHDVNDFVKKRLNLIANESQQMEQLNKETQNPSNIHQMSNESQNEIQQQSDQEENKKKKKKKRNKTNINRRQGQLKKQKRANFFKQL